MRIIFVHLILKVFYLETETGLVSGLFWYGAECQPAPPLLLRPPREGQTRREESHLRQGKWVKKNPDGILC